MQKEQILNDWKLIIKESIKSNVLNQQIIHRTFTLIYIPDNEILLIKNGKEHKNRKGKVIYSEGIISAYLSGETNELICLPKESYIGYNYSLIELLAKHNDKEWRLITEESRSEIIKNRLYLTFKLFHIPSNKVVKTFEGSITFSPYSEIDDGITGVCFSEDRKYLICTADYQVIGTYLVKDWLPK